MTSMNFRHAVGFLFVGLTLGLIPRIAPGWCLPGINGTSSRVLWLETMSVLQIGMAVTCMTRRAFAALTTLMEYDPRRAAAAAAAALPHAMARARERAQNLLPMPNSLKTGLLEQQTGAA